jgi:hypothetical protein
MSEIETSQVEETKIEVGTVENSKVALLFRGVLKDPVLLKFEEVDALGLAASIINAVLTLKNKSITESIQEEQNA